MLDLPRLRRVRLTARPVVQRLVALIGLVPSYHLPPRVHITLEGLDNLPDEPVLFAMNHTDRYNYWPFQYKLWRATGRYTATWVKGKYYETPALGWFMEATNNIPTVSRGYIIARDHLAAIGRPPEGAVYRALRTLVDREAAGVDEPVEGLDAVPRPIFARKRDVLGMTFDPAQESYPVFVNRLFGVMTGRFLQLNKEAFDKGLDVIVFPEGTRSVRLSRGRPGLAQIALKFGKVVVPVGCNGSDRVYPGASPWAQGGDIVYRIGAPITREEMAPFLPDTNFVPLTPRAEREHGEKFQGLTDLIMDRIEGLLDRRHRPTADLASDGVTGSERFV